MISEPFSVIIRILFHLFKNKNPFWLIAYSENNV